VKSEFAEYQKEQQRVLHNHQQVAGGFVQEGPNGFYPGGLIPGFSPNMQFVAPSPMQFQMFSKGIFDWL
jgi:hypothetical protein